MEEKTFELTEQPGYRLAIPLFLLTALPFFGGMLYDYIMRDEVNSVFIWFGGFYILAGLAYLMKKLRLKNKTVSKVA